MSSACYVIDAVRTPIGRFGGKLSSVRPDDMLATVIRALIERNPDVDPNAIEDIIAGAANQAGRTTGTWPEWPHYWQACQHQLGALRLTDSAPVVYRLLWMLPVPFNAETDFFILPVG